MIQTDVELQATQERILRFERFLAEAWKSASTENYQAMAEGYLNEIDRMQMEIRDYLSRLTEPVEGA